MYASNLVYVIYLCSNSKLKWKVDKLLAISQLTYTAEVNWKMLTRAGFEVAPSGYRSAALPVELSSPQGLEASFYPISVHEIFSRQLNAIHEDGCFFTLLKYIDVGGISNIFCYYSNFL